jgi:hypothetical protein
MQAMPKQTEISSFPKAASLTTISTTGTTQSSLQLKLPTKQLQQPKKPQEIHLNTERRWRVKAGKDRRPSPARNTAFGSFFINYLFEPKNKKVFTPKQTQEVLQLPSFAAKTSSEKALSTKPIPPKTMWCFIDHATITLRRESDAKKKEIYKKLQLRRQQFPLTEASTTQPLQMQIASPSRFGAMASQFSWLEKTGPKSKPLHPYQVMQQRQTLDTRHSSREMSLPAESSSQVGFFPIIGNPKYNLQKALIYVTKLHWPESTASKSQQKKPGDLKQLFREKPPPKSFAKDTSKKSHTNLLSSFRI